MKIYLVMALLALFALSSCHKKASDNHDGHNHATEAHNHGAEGCDHAHEEKPAKDDGHGHAEDDGHGHAAGESCGSSSASSESHADEIIMTKAQAKAAGLVVSKVEPTTFQQVIKTSGQVLVAQGDESVAVATVAGVVSFNGLITQGKSVSKGTPLVTISSRNLADGDPVQRARIAYDAAKKEYERMKPLVESQIVSQKEFTVAQQNYENARITYEAIANGSTGSGVAITAPIGGYVKNVLVNEGDYVTVGQPLVSVTQNRKLFLRADVSEKYYPVLTTIQSANFQTPYDNKVYELNAMGGKLLSTGKAAETNSFYVPVTFEFNNQGDIVPGSFVEIFLLSTPMPNVIALPRTALTEEQGLNFVYIQLDDEGYKRQEVTLGADNGVDVQILSGVKAGDAVVTKGAYQVRLASASSAIPHGHAH